MQWMYIEVFKTRGKTSTKKKDFQNGFWRCPSAAKDLLEETTAGGAGGEVSNQIVRKI